MSDVPIAVVTDYLGLIAAFRARVAALGMSYQTLDAIAGWADTYATKILTEEPPEWKGHKRRKTQRALGPMAFDALLGATGMKIVLIEDSIALERITAHRDYVCKKPRKHTNGVQPYIVRRVTSQFMRKIAAKGGRASRQNLPRWKRRRLARKAARAMWAKRRAKEAAKALAIQNANTSPAVAQPAPAQVKRRRQSAGNGVGKARGLRPLPLLRG